MLPVRNQVTIGFGQVRLQIDWRRACLRPGHAAFGLWLDVPALYIIEPEGTEELAKGSVRSCR
eukprot:13177129-Heterocapsa_arctica.AAC.1